MVVRHESPRGDRLLTGGFVTSSYTLFDNPCMSQESRGTSRGRAISFSRSIGGAGTTTGIGDMFFRMPIR